MTSAAKPRETADASPPEPARELSDSDLHAKYYAKVAPGFEWVAELLVETDLCFWEGAADEMVDYLRSPAAADKDNSIYTEVASGFEWVAEVLARITLRFGRGTADEMVNYLRLADAYESKPIDENSNIALIVENSRIAPYIKDMDRPQDIGGALTLKEKLDRIEAEYGEAAKEEFARRAPARDGALNAGMAASASIKAAAETTRPATPKLSEADLAAFMAYAKADENEWKPKSGVAPSAHIETKFADWLGRGLGLEHVRKAQANLAGAYSAEISGDPSKRIATLQTRPHTRHPKNPSEAPVDPVPVKRTPVAALTAEQIAQRREYQAAEKRRQRAEQRSAPS